MKYSNRLSKLYIHGTPSLTYQKDKDPVIDDDTNDIVYVNPVIYDLA